MADLRTRMLALLGGAGCWFAAFWVGMFTVFIAAVSFTKHVQDVADGDDPFCRRAADWSEVAVAGFATVGMGFATLVLVGLGAVAFAVAFSGDIRGPLRRDG